MFSYFLKKYNYCYKIEQTVGFLFREGYTTSVNSPQYI